MQRRTRLAGLALAVASLGATFSAQTVGADSDIPGRDASKPLTIVDSGVAPDGSTYQHLLYATQSSGYYWVDNKVGGRKKHFHFAGWCKSFRFVGGGAPRGGGALCEGPRGPSDGEPAPVGGFSPRLVSPGTAGSAAYLAGHTSSKVARVRVVYRDPSGNEQDLAVDFAKVEGRQLASAAKKARSKKAKPRRGKTGKRKGKRSAVFPAPEAYGVFTAFLPGEVVARDDLAGRARAGDEANDPNPLGDPARTGDLGGLGFDGDRCDDWVGPFKVVAYDQAGQELDVTRCRTAGGATAR